MGYIWRTCFYWIVFIEIPNPKSKPHQRKKIRTLNESACIDSLTWISLRIWTSTTIWSERLTVGSIETVLITAAKRTTPSKCVSAFQMVWKLCQKNIGICKDILKWERDSVCVWVFISSDGICAYMSNKCFELRFRSLWCIRSSVSFLFAMLSYTKSSQTETDTQNELYSTYYLMFGYRLVMVLSIISMKKRWQT